MANRVSEPAPQPAAAPAPPPAPVSTRSPGAQKMGIPDFGQETADPSPVAIAWDDYDADDGGGMPTSSGGTVNLEGTERPAEGRPTKVKKTNINVAGTSAEVDPDAHLDAHGEVTDAEGIEGKAQPGDGDEAPAVVKPNGAERRRLALEALSKERQTRDIENNLISERAQREALEKKLKTATLGELLSLRGKHRDEALEELIAGKENDGNEPQLTPEQKELARQRSELDAIKKERDAEKQENARLQREGYMSRCAEIVRGVESVPVVHVALKRNLVVDKDENGAPLHAAEWIEGLARAEWEKNGAVQGKQQQFLKAAAEVLEDYLIEQNDPIVQAILAKQGKAEPETVQRTATPPRPPSLRRPAARPDARPKPLPRDRDQLDLEIKRRFNLG